MELIRWGCVLNWEDVFVTSAGASMATNIQSVIESESVMWWMIKLDFLEPRFYAQTTVILISQFFLKKEG